MIFICLKRFYAINVLIECIDMLPHGMLLPRRHNCLMLLRIYMQGGFLSKENGAVRVRLSFTGEARILINLVS